MSDTKINIDELDWVKVQEDLRNTYAPETMAHKLKRKTIENPFVPIGCLATTSALVYGVYNFYKGNEIMQQYMMRARVGAQAFTIVCVVAGLMLMPKSNQH